MKAEIDQSGVKKAYARWAPVYDYVFGALFDSGRRAAIDAAERVGGTILEIGVGTGISLPDYSRDCRIVGVDLSAHAAEGKGEGFGVRAHECRA